MSRRQARLNPPQIIRLAEIGLTEIQIRAVLGYPDRFPLDSREESFRQHCREGRASGAQQVAEALFRSATDPDNPSVSAQLFYLRTAAGWMERGDGSGTADAFRAPAREEILSRVRTLITRIDARRNLALLPPGHVE